jgi:glycerol kinase
MPGKYVLGIDQGSSGSKAVIIDQHGRVCGLAYRRLERLHPRLGWVEIDPYAVIQGVAEAVTEAIGQAGIHPQQIVGCGLAGQRNTAFAWDSRDGTPIANPITWQDQRTAPLLAELADWPLVIEAQQRLGYAPGTYMAALHLAWRNRHHDLFQEAARSGYLRLGLSPSWIVRSMGHQREHVMDTSLVQAIGLYDIRAGRYWPEWLDRLDIPDYALPGAVPTLYDFGVLGVTSPAGERAEIPVLAMIGDQQGALFGQDCRYTGAAECTHGTASYVKVFLGQQAPFLDKVYVYNAWHLGRFQTYCLEAPTTVTGAAIRWMREAHLFTDYNEMDLVAAQEADSGGVVFIPAFTGLEFPEVDPHMRGTILGLTLGSNRAHLFRAFYESIGYQIRAILETIQTEAQVTVNELLVGGGLSTSDIACQVQADLLGLPILRPTFTETTAWAAGLLAGLGAGLWSTEMELPPLPGSRQRFDPEMAEEKRHAGYERWQHAVAMTRNWHMPNMV